MDSIGKCYFPSSYGEVCTTFYDRLIIYIYIQVEFRESQHKERIEECIPP